MQKPGFSWLTPVLCVSNLAQSLEHYERVLGFEVAWKWSENEAFDETDKPTFACVCRGEASIFMCENGQGNPGAWICLTLGSRKELDEVFAEYRKTAADIAEEPTDCPWGMREMLVRDPDKNTFRIGCVIEQ